MKTKKSKNLKRENKKGFGYIVSEGTAYIKESFEYILLVVAIFAVSAIFGFFFSDKLLFLNSILKDILLQVDGLGGFDTTTFILTNNAKTAFFGIFFGAAFGLLPLFNAIANGVVLGYVFKLVFDISGVLGFWRILPHGIFELPAIFISLGLGLKLGMSLFSGNFREEFKRRFRKSFFSFIGIVLPLLTIAAIIEGILIVFSV